METDTHLVDIGQWIANLVYERDFHLAMIQELKMKIKYAQALTTENERNLYHGRK